MKNIKTKVEEIIRIKGITDKIIWRDNQKSTYQRVYDYLLNHPEYQFNK